MTTIVAIILIGVALVAICALAVWLTNENEKEDKSSSNQQVSAKSAEDAKEDVLTNNFFHQPYMDGCGLWSDGFYPYNPL